MERRGQGPGTPGGTSERPATFFASAQELRRWLEENHETAPELWMGLRGKHVAERGLTWAEAVPVALCFGWIDSVSQRIDDDARRQRWTPRRSGSIWSAVNVAHVEQLTQEGLMHPAGVAAFERRRPERTAVYAYEGAAPAEIYEAVRAALAASPAAQAFWDEATPSYRRTATAWIQGAKREATRASRLSQLVQDCAEGRLIPSQRHGERPRWAERAATAAAAARGAQG